MENTKTTDIILDQKLDGYGTNMDAYEFFGHYYCEDCLERHYVTVEREA